MATQHSPEEFHCARSRLVDAFGKVEAAICSRLIALDREPGKQQPGQKIENLEAVKASPSYSKAVRKTVHAALDRFKPLNDVRCDIVHAPMELIQRGNASYACFINPRDFGSLTTTARHIDLATFERLITDLDSIAADLG